MLNPEVESPMVKKAAKRILVIEDAQSLRRDIMEMLNFEGFEVSGAENGLIGVNQAKDNLPDLIICDIMMPAMDGYTVLEKLREHTATQTIPFIFLTARTDRVDMRQGMELGANDYLTKPFTANELLNTVKTRLQQVEILRAIQEREKKQLTDSITIALPHELRTPLNVILGFSDLLMTDFNVMEPVRMGDMARHINSAAMRLYRLIENFLAYANIEVIAASEERIADLRRTTTESPQTSIEITALQKAQMDERETDLVMNVENVPALQIHEEYLRKMIEELVSNAVKFSEAGTPIQLNAKPEGDVYVVSVHDQGRGMTPEQIKNIGSYRQFEREYYEHQGVGLGLVITQRLAELHGGSLKITSVYGEQTTVRVELPLPPAN